MQEKGTQPTVQCSNVKITFILLKFDNSIGFYIFKSRITTH